MPEAIVCLFVVVVAVSAYLVAHFLTAVPVDPRAEALRLQQQRTWLKERLQRSAAESWEQGMRDRLAAELEIIEAQLITIGK